MNILLTVSRSQDYWYGDIGFFSWTFILWAFSWVMVPALLVLWGKSPRRPTHWKNALSLLALLSSILPIYASALQYQTDYVSYEMYLTGECGESYDRHWIIELFWVYLPFLIGLLSLSAGVFLSRKQGS